MGAFPATLKFVNKTTEKIVSTWVEKGDNFDFLGEGKPDILYKGLIIEPGQSETTSKMYLNDIARNTPFTIWFYFEDGTEDKYRIDISYLYDYSPKIEHDGPHNIYYEKDGHTLIITLGNTFPQSLRNRMEELNKKAEKKRSKKKYEEAINDINRALIFANSETQKRKLLEKRSEIETEQAMMMFLTAVLQFEMNTKEGDKEAQELMVKVEELFKKAKKDHDTEKTRNQVKLAEVKIAAHKGMTKADELSEESFTLDNEGKYTEAKKKAEEAEIYYKKAIEKFKSYTFVEGKLFQETKTSVQFRNEAEAGILLMNEKIEELEKIINPGQKAGKKEKEKKKNTWDEENEERFDKNSEILDKVYNQL